MYLKSNSIKTNIAAICMVGLINFCCKKIVAVDPPITSITTTNAFSSDLSATAILTDMYATMSNSSFSNPIGLPTLSIYAGLSADEFTLWSGVPNSSPFYFFYTNTLVSNSMLNVGSSYWDYTAIYRCNDAILKLNNSTLLSPAVKKQLLGEAKFMRALNYFYMVNLYGDLPLQLGTDYKINTLLSRSTKAQVYQQIVSDLIDAKSLLSDLFLNGSLVPYGSNTILRIRPTSWAATALLSRVYLYIGDYPNAEAQSTLVINDSSVFKIVALDSVFLANSNETIWALQPVTTGTITNTQDGYYFNIPAGGPNYTLPNPNSVYLSDTLLKSFEITDQRKIKWVKNMLVATTNYYFPYKYRISSGTVVSEYIMMFRLAEQYLIRSEARAQLNNITGAQSDLNVIRKRAGLTSTVASDQSSLMNALIHERQVELFSEMGHRWLDLKRTNLVDQVMKIIAPKKGSIWQSFQQLYPIKYSDIVSAPNIIQNTGY